MWWLQTLGLGEICRVSCTKLLTQCNEATGFDFCFPGAHRHPHRRARLRRGPGHCVRPDGPDGRVRPAPDYARAAGDRHRVRAPRRAARGAGLHPQPMLRAVCHGRQHLRLRRRLPLRPHLRHFHLRRPRGLLRTHCWCAGCYMTCLRSGLYGLADTSVFCTNEHWKHRFIQSSAFFMIQNVGFVI